MCQMTRIAGPLEQTEFINWLDEQLKQRGWTDSQLSKKAGISHSVISKARKGERPIGWDACVAISNALKLSPVIVLRHANLLPPEPDVDLELDELAYLYQQLPEEDRKRILSIARTFQPKKDN
jgi:transcriptional regulator with XRE-family HTH domain